MLSLNRRFSVAGVVLLAGIMALSGCATRKYVRQQTQKLEPAIQEAANGVKENAERIDGVDRRGQQGIAAAAAADTKATTAGQAAATAQTAAQAADRKADTANQGVQQANNRIGTMETTVNNINVLDTYTQSETQTVTFQLNKSTLTDQAQGTFDRIASSLSGPRNGRRPALPGYTDGTRSEHDHTGP